MQDYALGSRSPSDVDVVIDTQHIPKGMYAVRDAKTEVFSPPFIALTHGEAIRSFSGLCSNPETLIHKYPADYALFYLGQYFEANGSLKPAVQVLQLSSALEHVRPAGGQPVVVK